MAGFQFPFKIGPRDLFRGNDFFDGENINADTLSVWVRENKFSFDVIQQLLGKLYPYREELLTSPNYERRFFTNLAATIGDISAFSGLSKDHSNVFITVDLVEGKTDQILLLPIDTSSTPTGSSSISGTVKTSEQQLTANGNWYALNGSKVIKLFKVPGAGESITYKVNIPAYKYTQEATVIPSMAQLEDGGDKCSVTYRGLEGNYAKYEIQFPAISNLITGVGTDGELEFGAVTFSGTAPVYMLPAKFRGNSVNLRPYLEGSDKAGLELPFGSVFCWNTVTGLPVYTDASSASFGSEEVKFITCSSDFGNNPADNIDPTKLIMLVPNQQQLADHNGNLIEEDATDSETYAFVFEAETLSEKIAKITALLEYFNSSITGIDTASLTNRFVSGANPTKTQNPVTPKPSKIEGNFFPQYLLRQGYQANSDSANLDNAMLGDIVLPYYQSSDVNVLLANPSTNPLTRALKFGTSGELKGKTYSSAQYGDADFITASKGIELTNNLLKFGATPNAAITWNSTDSDLRVLIGNYIGASFKAGYLALPTTNTTSWNVAGYTKGVELSPSLLALTPNVNDYLKLIVNTDYVGLSFKGSESFIRFDSSSSKGIYYTNTGDIAFINFPLRFVSSGSIGESSSTVGIQDVKAAIDPSLSKIYAGAFLLANSADDVIDDSKISLSLASETDTSPNFNNATSQLGGSDWWIDSERVKTSGGTTDIKTHIDDAIDNLTNDFNNLANSIKSNLYDPSVNISTPVVLKSWIILLDNGTINGQSLAMHDNGSNRILSVYNGGTMDFDPINDISLMGSAPSDFNYSKIVNAVWLSETNTFVNLQKAAPSKVQSAGTVSSGTNYGGIITIFYYA